VRMTLNSYFIFWMATSLFGVAVLLFLLKSIKSIVVDNAKASHIAAAIRVGAMTFLKEEYKVILGVVVLLTALIGIFVNLWPAICFVAGALISMFTGYVGMVAATHANVRTTMAAKNEGEHGAFLISFFGGGVMGFAVASLGLLGLGTLFYLSF